jgi:hypothetical protein
MTNLTKVELASLISSIVAQVMQGRVPGAAPKIPLHDQGQNALLEQIWNTLRCAGCNSAHWLPRNSFQGIDADHPSNKPNAPLSLACSIIRACYVTTLSSSVASQSPSVRQLNALALHHARGTRRATSRRRRCARQLIGSTI